MHSLYQKIKRHGSAVAFITGFIWDNFMLTQVDHLFANVMLGSYLGISAISILVMNMPSVSGWRASFTEKAAKWLPIVLQFCFGSLFSAYIIFYTRSASLSTDWPFLLFLVSLVVSNELLRQRYLSITLPVSILFTVLFSYGIFSLPILLGSMGPEIFITSGLASLFVIMLFSKLLALIAKEHFRASRRSLAVTVAVIYLLFNLAYFTNVIPPVPLALKAIGVYHSIKRQTDKTYALTFEPSWWYPLTSKPAGVFHRKGNEPVYVWSAIFAPGKLTVPVFHLWQYYDERDKKWVATDLVEFPIRGGRDQGFRGYSMKSGVFPAKWRVDALTARKDIIGRVEFTLENTTTSPANLVTETH
ncbi:MAG: DUF2914 domain-containing protein [Candidatus Taylorbacteria bacterium]|nr:DUF2914 domain-containing protein [Candidatus Taylorbacteria bacterium]